MTTSFAPVGDIEITYLESGPRDAQPVLLGHCFCADHWFWDAHLRACEGFQTVRFDTRGHGASGRTDGPYTLTQPAGDVLGLMDHVGLAKVH